MEIDTMDGGDHSKGFTKPSPGGGGGCRHSLVLCSPRTRKQEFVISTWPIRCDSGGGRGNHQTLILNIVQLVLTISPANLPKIVDESVSLKRANNWWKIYW